MASISRFGRAISSGKSASDNSLPSRASVSSAVRSSRLVKSGRAVPVVIKNSSRSSWAGQSVMAPPSSIPERGSPRALKRLEKAGYVSGIAVDAGHLSAGACLPRTRNVDFARCPKFVADFAGCAAAAISSGAALPYRPSGLDADGLALSDRCTDVAALDRFWRDLALAATLGGGVRGREILQPPRHRLGRAARGDRRGGRW